MAQVHFVECARAQSDDAWVLLVGIPVGNTQWRNAAILPAENGDAEEIAGRLEALAAWIRKTAA